MNTYQPIIMKNVNEESVTMKRIICVILTAAILIIIFFLIHTSGFSLALIRAGFNTNDVEVIEHSYDSAVGEFKVIKTSSKEHKIILACMSRNSFGFWKVITTSEVTSVRPDIVEIAWVRGAGAKRFTHTENAIFENEWHYAYYGTNATKLIEFLPGQIPENVAVNIRQAGQQFWIHLVSYGEPDVLSRIKMEYLLEESKSISSK